MYLFTLVCVCVSMSAHIIVNEWNNHSNFYEFTLLLIRFEKIFIYILYSNKIKEFLKYIQVASYAVGYLTQYNNYILV